MLAGILITIREGLEAFLIIGILLGYLSKVGRQDSKRQIWIGAGAAIILSAAIAGVFQLLSLKFSGLGEELFEAIISLAAVGVLTWMVLWMQKQSRHIKGELEHKLDQALSSNQIFALASLAFFSVLREGLETALFLSALARSAKDGLFIGSIIGLVIAAVITYIIFNTSIRLNLRGFFIATGTMLIFIAAGIIGHVAHPLEEIGLISGPLAQTVWNSGSIISDSGLLGRLLHVFIGYSAKPTLIQIIVYVAYLAFFGSRFYAVVTAAGSPTKKSNTHAEAATSKAE